MSALTLELGTELDALDPEDAVHIQRAVREMIQLARRRKDPATAITATKPFSTQAQPLGLKVGQHSHKWTDWLDEAEGPGWK